MYRCLFFVAILSSTANGFGDENLESTKTMRLILENTIERVDDLVDEIWTHTSQLSDMAEMSADENSIEISEINLIDDQFNNIFELLQKCKRKQDEGKLIALTNFDGIEEKLETGDRNFTYNSVVAKMWMEKNKERAHEIQSELVSSVKSILENAGNSTMLDYPSNAILDLSKHFVPLVEDGGLLICTLIKRLSQRIEML